VILLRAGDLWLSPSEVAHSLQKIWIKCDGVHVVCVHEVWSPGHQESDSIFLYSSAFSKKEKKKEKTTAALVPGPNPSQDFPSCNVQIKAVLRVDLIIEL
jgi:hypothetical protein